MIVFIVVFNSLCIVVHAEAFVSSYCLLQV